MLHETITGSALLNDNTEQSLIFIPDISGFTNFVNDTEIKHSQHIISELLGILLKSNNIGLQPAEIEGDAVMFYRQDIPDLYELFDQVRRMYIDFHHHLRKYETLRICQCGACRTASSLSIKFIAHAGPVSFIDVDKFHKPFGKAVITAHKLLKNAIDGNEYLLMTDELLRMGSTEKIRQDSIKLVSGTETNPVVSYRFIPLTFLNQFIPPVEHFVVPQKNKNPLRLEIVINRPAEEIHPLLLDLEFKKRWNRNIKDIRYDENLINRSGLSHTCIVNNRELHFKTITDNSGPERWVYGEKLQNPFFVKEADFYFILEKIEPFKTLVKMELHYKKRPGLLKPLALIFRKMMKKHFTDNLARLKQVIESDNLVR